LSTSTHIIRAKKVLEIEISELQRLHDRIDESFSHAVKMIHDALNTKGKIVILGVGKSENIAVKAVATLNSTGATAVHLNCQNALHGDLGMICEGDVVIAMSHSGETDELLSLLPYVKQRAKKIIALTGKAHSTLAKHSDIILDINVKTEACPLGLAPTSSSTCMLALSDAIAMTLLEARGFKADDFASLHPAGSLGKQLLTKVTDIMRTSDQLAIVSPSDSVENALITMSKQNAGAAIVTENSKLIGIFTHGDFVRSYQKDKFIGEKEIGSHMTKSPISIQQDKLAVEVINLLKSNRIDELIVINTENQPVGVVDAQDLTRHKLI